MKKRFFTAWLAIIAALPLSAAVSLPGIFSDHAVLAKKAKVPVFGKADPGEKVVVEFNKQKRETVAGKNGKWRVDLNLADSPEGPFELKVNNIVIKDVIVGEVWLCSGQSNMAWRLNRSEGFSLARTKPVGSRLRSFNVSLKSMAQPSDVINGKWVYADPANVGSFSGVGYFFGKKLLAELNTPVGLINDAWGGSPIEAWMTSDAAKVVPMVAQRDAETSKAFKAYPEKRKKYLTDVVEWANNNGRKDTVRKCPDAGTKWKKVSTVPVGSGVIWIRNQVTSNETSLKFNLQRQRVPFTVWVDGKMVFEWSLESAVLFHYPRFTVSGLKPGKHEIMFRIYNPLSINRKFNTSMVIGPVDFGRKKWEYFREVSFKNKTAKAPELPAAPREFFNSQRLFNGCIYGLLPYAIDGVIWYQGENNAKRFKEYAALKRALIADWRKHFEFPEMPFYWCNLANYKPKNANADAFEVWAAFRDAQTAALDVPHTGQAILIDVGESHSIHPIDKKTPGERLAAIALANVYGKKVPFLGPSMSKVVREGDKMRVSFKDVEGGLCVSTLPDHYYEVKAHKRKAKLIRNSPDTQVEGFAICGKDGKWHWADKAVIDGDTVVVSSVKVPEPVAVRYAWQNNPHCNLYNKAGFPAVPFQKKDIAK